MMDTETLPVPVRQLSDGDMISHLYCGNCQPVIEQPTRVLIAFCGYERPPGIRHLSGLNRCIVCMDFIESNPYVTCPLCGWCADVTNTP